VRVGKLEGTPTGGVLHVWRMDGTPLVNVPLDVPVLDVQFTADGKQLATAMGDTTILVWDLPELLHAGLANR
jgi:WD40 repeat protein